MNPTVLAIRAVTATFARQFLKPLLFIGIGIYLVVMGLIIWVAIAVSAWWLLLTIVPTFLIAVGLGVWLIVWRLAGRLAPTMNKRQRTATKKFVRHIGEVAEHMGTPRFLLLFRVLKDVVARPKSNKTFIGELSRKPGEVKRDFDDLRKLF